jgi:hypothetical protein
LSTLNYTQLQLASTRIVRQSEANRGAKAAGQGDVSVGVGEDKLAEQVFIGALMVSTMLIAVSGVVAAGYEKISGIPEVEFRFRYFLVAVAGVSALAALISTLAFERMRGVAVPIGLITVSVHILIFAAAVASVGIVAITVY